MLGESGTGCEMYLDWGKERRGYTVENKGERIWRAEIVAR